MMKRIGLRRRLHRLRLWAAYRLERLLTVERMLHGIPVHVYNLQRDQYDNALLFQKVEAALDLIAAHRPVWVPRMRRDVSRISVRLYPVCRAAFYHASRSLVLDTYFVATFPVLEIASSIVHEAAHARIRARLPNLPPGHRGREERVCRKAQLRFARALPDSGEHAARMEALVRAPDEELAPVIDWNEPHRRAELARIDKLAPPAWIRRWLVRRVERRYPRQSPAPPPGA